jgi:acyl-CoA synthetase (AMP-forming)/AMP-acid ligase II
MIIGNIRNTYLLTPADRTLLVMPLFHVHGLLAGFLAPLFSGGLVVIPQRFSASDFWQVFVRHGANWYTAVPTIHQLLLRLPIPEKLPRIRFIRSCSSPLSPTTFHELETKFKAPVLEAYAMTEAAHQITSNPLPPASRRAGSIGIGQGVEVKILDEHGQEVPFGTEAEICIRGPNVTRGYLNNDEANRKSFTKDNFFRTGDLGKQDQDGYIILTGRIKEIINKGGEKISPNEIDNVVVQNPSVAEAVSFAIDDHIYGQDIGIAIVLRDDATLSESDLRSWIRERVAAFKVPKEVNIVIRHRSYVTLLLMVIDLFHH